MSEQLNQTSTETGPAPSIPSPLEGQGLVPVLQFGLRLWAEEMKWLGKKLFRAVEVRQLEKRLQQELTLLGTLAADPKSAESAIDLAKKQVEFLKTEIVRVREEFEAKRAFFLKERRIRLGLGNE